MLMSYTRTKYFDITTKYYWIARLITIYIAQTLDFIPTYPWTASVTQAKVASIHFSMNLYSQQQKVI